jgi:ATP-binding cassette subfamily B protein
MKTKVDNKFYKVMWILKKAVRYCFIPLLVNVLIMSFITLLNVVINIVNKNMVNELTEIIGLNKVSGLFIGLVILYLMIYFLKMASNFLSVFGGNFCSFKVTAFFHRLFMLKSNEIEQEKFFDSAFMDKYSFVSGNTGKINMYISGLLGLVFSNIGSIVSAMIIFWIYEPWLILYAAVITIVTAITTGIVSKKEFDLDKKQIKEQRHHDYYKNVLTIKEYAKEVRLYGIKDFLFDRWTKVYEKLRKERLELALKRIVIYNRSATIKFLAYSVSIAILLLGIYNKKYDVGTFVMLFGFAESCRWQIGSFVSRIVSGTYKDVNYLVEYYNYISPISENDINKSVATEADETNLMHGILEKIEVSNVSFTYPGSEIRAVDGVSFYIKKGEIISILGYNGSGKTTLAKILNGSFFPSEGEVRLNGYVLKNDKDEKGNNFKYFGVAPQEYSCFSLPIKELVGLGCINKMNDDSALRDSYRKSGVNSIIDKLSEGDKTILGKQYDENGIDLSGGEWQRLIISSAYFGEPEILLLDEPTASIDPLMEMKMIQNLRENLKGKTAILISHRIGFARIADRILFMEKGKLTEQGTHEELLKLSGSYARLFHEQKKLYEEVSYS